MSSAGGFSGQVVAAIRAEMGWRNLATRDLAATLRISPRAAARRLNGDVDISLNELSAIASWLTVEASELLEIHRPRTMSQLSTQDAVDSRPSRTCAAGNASLEPERRT